MTSCAFIQFVQFSKEHPVHYHTIRETRLRWNLHISYSQTDMGSRQTNYDIHNINRLGKK